MSAESPIQCEVCLRHCRLKPGERGFCGLWSRQGDAITRAAPFVVAECAVEAVEKKGLYHYRPGSLVYSLGGWGCNLHCAHCRNHQVACVRSPPEAGPFPPPERVLDSAQASGCAGIAWGYTEPTLWYDALAEVSVRARERGLFSLVCTNGIASRAVYQALIESGVTVWKLDFKGFSAAAYRRVAGFSGWRGILANLVLLKSAGSHVELSWCPIPGAHSNLKQARALGRWIVNYLSSETPVHLNVFFPAYRRSGLPFGDMTSLRNLRDVLFDAGMRHVYLPQSLARKDRVTWCEDCRAVLAERPALGQPKLYTDGSNRCKVCGHSAPLVLQ